VNTQHRNQERPASGRRLTFHRHLLASACGVALLGAVASCNDNDRTYVVGGPGPGSPGYTPNSIAVADVNGDGVPDLLVARTFDQGLAQDPGLASVYLGMPSSPGTYQPGTDYPLTGTNPSGIAAVALAGSGTADMVVSNFGNGTASVFMHDPANPGKYLAATTLTTGGQPNQVVSADINGDGKPDLVFADLSTNGNAVVLLQNATTTGTFAAPLNLPTGGMTASVAVGDLNGDGKPDIVATTFDINGNNGQVVIFFQNAASPGTFAAGVTFPAGAQPQAVRIMDVNGDGLPDLVVANRGPGTDGTGAPGVSVLLQDPAHPGSFLAPVNYSTPWGAIDVAVGDLNGDGKPDLVVASIGPAPNGAVSVLLQSTTAPGTFGTASSYPGFGQPLSVAIADLNGDGHPDIAVADGYSATVMLQNASQPGTFSNAMVVN
jgi:FG-GAP-like repeat/FG-GAP repeat